MASNFDNTALLAPYLDAHMIGPILDFIRETELYDAKTITKEKIRSVLKTNMTELVEDEYLKYANDAELKAEFAAQKPALELKKQQTFALLDHEPEESKQASLFFAQKDLIAELASKNNLNLEYISSKHQITLANLDAYYKYSKFKYECGMYKEAEEMLGNFLSVSQSAGSSFHMSALWGRLACHILLAKWNDTVNDLLTVRDAIDSQRGASPIAQLQQRAGLMHWTLFTLLGLRDGPEVVADLFSDNKNYLPTLENLCPWLLRYYTAAVILSPSRRRTHLRDLLKEIKFVSYMYSDPLTQFLESLFDQFDFDEAQVKLQQCQKLVKNDFFLRKFADKFMHEARMLICEMYCAIHHSVDIVMLAQKLHLTEEEAERWMVDIVRGSTPDKLTAGAKIDSSLKVVTMAEPERSAVVKQVMDTTRELTTRSAILASNVENVAKDQAMYISQILRN